MSRTRRPRLERIAWPFALAVAVIPLWIVHELPLVDLPQHSYVVARADPLFRAPAPCPRARPRPESASSMGPAYDHFLGRGRAPETVFGERLGAELHVAARAGDWWLVRRRP